MNEQDLSKEKKEWEDYKKCRGIGENSAPKSICRILNG